MEVSSHAPSLAPYFGDAKASFDEDDATNPLTFSQLAPAAAEPTVVVPTGRSRHGAHGPGRMTALLKIPTLQLRGPAFYGWLWKKGSSFKTWKKRFFLLHGRTLTYYEQACVVHSKDFGTRCLELPSKGGLRVASASLTDATEFGIQIQSSSGRVLYVQAGDHGSRMEWLHVLQQASNRTSIDMAGRSTTLSEVGVLAPSEVETPAELLTVPSSSTVSSDEDDVGPTDMQGWLAVRSSLTGFKRRFITLIDGHLTITSNERSRRAQDVKHEVISVTRWTGHEFGLHICLDRHKELFVHAASREERHQWEDALRNCA
ncbi:hypothetical protein P43SY_008648 [Pythium insidiosum]|uniref:PH domain-containing protein n=1 Tax=Pythium insidiosum TaxID=114742 RepID=A0AAD5LY52_PYTIN|nr:hypothetical protein P43SY_008648 [Pythium insidiosum]